jgi:putative polyketide hydroxylase
MTSAKVGATSDSTSVLVVGGSLVGLSSALFLAARGVPTVVVERHAGSSPHPRAIGYTPRTMELLRAVDVARHVPEAPANFRLLRARVESLAGAWFDQSAWTPAAAEPQPPKPKLELSPCRGAAFAQDRLEPLLRARAVELGAEVRARTELVSFEQDRDGVTARLRTRDGVESTVRAAYLIAADGARSQVRDALGIDRHGRGHIQTIRSVLFRAPLEAYLEKGVRQFEIDEPDLRAFLTTYNDGRWVLMLHDDLDRDEATLRAAIFRAIGRSDVAVEILATGRWELAALVANQFAVGRVFLAGDAAHTLPPTRGGFGANTGIHDAHNLAWKLAAVLSGASRAELLDTYDAERRPVAWVRHQQIFARPDYAAVANGVAEGEPILDDDALELGQLYQSAAVLGAAEGLPLALRPEEWAGQPGTRAPHAWLAGEASERQSTVDLLQRGWALLSAHESWRRAARDAGDALGLDVAFHWLGATAPGWPARYRTALGLGLGGASLVRPDGVVAWRAADRPAEPTAVLTGVLKQVAAAARSRA